MSDKKTENTSSIEHTAKKANKSMIYILIAVAVALLVAGGVAAAFIINNNNKDDSGLSENTEQTTNDDNQDEEKTDEEDVTEESDSKNNDTETPGNSGEEVDAIGFLKEITAFTMEFESIGEDLQTIDPNSIEDLDSLRAVIDEAKDKIKNLQTKIRDINTSAKNSDEVKDVYINLLSDVNSVLDGIFKAVEENENDPTAAEAAIQEELAIFNEEIESFTTDYLTAINAFMEANNLDPNDISNSL
ncbi:MAG: hypothetical protein Kow0081_4860 [Candidatus Dojkabacteria bacterium]